MTLAIALIACIAAALVLAATTRVLPDRWHGMPTIGAAVIPLVALVLLMREAPLMDSGDQFQVVGQFAPIGDTITFGTGAASDVRLTAFATDSTSVVRVLRQTQSGPRVITVSPGMPLVSTGSGPVNAARLGRTSLITLLGQDTTIIQVRMPSWPLSCRIGLTSVCAIRELKVTRGAASIADTIRVVRVGRVPVTQDVFGLPAGTLPGFTIHRIGGEAFITSAEPQLVRIDGDTLPNTADVKGDSITLGRGADAIRFRFRDDVAAGRQQTLFTTPSRAQRWTLAGGAGMDRFRVAGGGVTPLGTLPLIDLNEWPIARAVPYEGVIAVDGGGWSWSHHGVRIPMTADSTYQFAADERSRESRGHLVRIARSTTGASPLILIAVLWIAGALLLAFNATQYGGALSWLRVLLLGLAYTLILVRSVIAIRVSLAPPSLADARTSLTALLIILPCTLVLVERWEHLWSRWGVQKRGGPAARGWRRVVERRYLFYTMACLAVGPAVVFAASQWNTSLAILATSVVVLGIIGLVAIQVILLPSHEGGAALQSPLAILSQPRDRELGLDRLFRAVAGLFLLVLFYLELYFAQRVPLAAVLAAHLALIGAVWRFVALRETIGPHRDRSWLVKRAIAFALPAGLLAAFTAGEAAPLEPFALAAIIGAVTAVVVAVVTAWVYAPLVRMLRGGVFLRREILPPLWALLLPAVCLLFSPLAVVRRFGITLGFALGVCAALVLIRVLAVLWHNDTRERMRMLFLVQRKRLPWRHVALALVLSASLLAGHVFVDRGLLQLVVGALIVTLFTGMAALGRRALLLPTLALGVTVGAWYAALHSTEHALNGGRVWLPTPRIRAMAASAPDSLQHQLVYADAAKGREIVNTLVQEWGMRSHAAMGGARGAGLFSVPFSGRAIGAREAVTDNTYSVFILAEHGFAGGMAVLLLYVALSCAMLVAGFFAARTFAELPRALLLAACAAFIAVPALYMIAANVGSVALTGQNLPLLGIRSGADVALFVWIMMLAVAALPRHNRALAEGVQVDREYARQMWRVRSMLTVVGATIVVIAGLLVHPIWAATTGFTPEPFRLDGFASSLRDLVAARTLTANSGRVVLAGNGPDEIGQPGSVIDNAIRRANRDPSVTGGGHCLDGPSWLAARRNDVVVGLECYVGLSPNGRDQWAGALTTRRDGISYLVAGDRHVLAADSRLAAPALVSCRDTANVSGQRVDIDCSGARLTLGIIADTLRFTASATKDISINGLALAAPTRALGWGDVINVSGAATYVIDTVPRSAIGFSRWRNGERARAVDPAASPLLVKLDSLLAGGLRVSDDHAATDDVELTLDAKLQSRIHGALGKTCATARQCSVILVTPETGDIMAMASVVDTSVHVPSYAPLDANFREHRAASVIKPLIAASVLARYPSLTTLVVEQPDERIESVAGWKIAGSMKSPRRGCPGHDRQVGWDCFLPTSNNLYAATLGFLGAARVGADGMPALEDDATGPSFLLGGRRTDRRPSFTTANGKRRYADSPLAHGLRDLFGAEMGTRSGAFDKSMWARLQDAGLLRVNDTWQRVSPPIPQLDLDGPQFTDLHHLAGFMIGETENNWSNALLVRGASRLYTGRAIDLRLIKRVGSATLAPSDAAALAFGTGREAVLSGMRNVVRGFGTASLLDGKLPAGIQLWGKTGTLDSEGFSGTSSFMFVATREGHAACSVAGVIHVEGFEDSGATVVTGKELFLRGVLPALLSDGPWKSVECAGAPAPVAPKAAPTAKTVNTKRRSPR